MKEYVVKPLNRFNIHKMEVIESDEPVLALKKYLQEKGIPYEMIHRVTKEYIQDNFPDISPIDLCNKIEFEVSEHILGGSSFDNCSMYIIDWF